MLVAIVRKFQRIHDVPPITLIPLRNPHVAEPSTGICMRPIIAGRNSELHLAQALWGRDLACYGGGYPPVTRARGRHGLDVIKAVKLLHCRQSIREQS